MRKSKKRPLMPKNILFLTIPAIIFFNSCTKINIQNEERSPIDQSEAFFTLPSGTKPIVEKVAAQMKKLNIANEFINQLALHEGYAIWNKAIINKNNSLTASQSFTLNNIGGNNDSTVIIPLVLINTRYVNAFIVANVSDTITMKLYRARDYANYGFKTAAVNDSIHAENIALEILALDSVTFGTTAIHITDMRMFNFLKPANVSRDPISRIIKINSAIQNNLSITICYSYDVEELYENPFNVVCPPGQSCQWTHTVTHTICTTLDNGGGQGPGGPGIPIGGGGIPSSGGEIPTGGGGSGGGPGGVNCPWWITTCWPQPAVVLDPCAFVDQLKMDANFVQKFRGLTNPNVLAKDYEVGYMVNDRMANIYTPLQGNPFARNINWNIAPGTKVDGLLHSHYGGLDNVFSPDDLIIMAKTFIKGFANDTNHLFMGLTSGMAPGSSQQDFPYLLTVGNVAKFRAFAIKIVGENGNDKTKMDLFKKKYEPIFTKTANINTYLEDHLIAFMKLIKNEAGNGGLVLFHATDNQCNNWTRLMLNNAEHAVSDDCPTL